MKTAMQELIERIREYRDLENSPLVISRLNSVLVDAIGMLDKEAQVSVEAAKQYAEFCVRCDREGLAPLELHDFIRLYYNTEEKIRG